MIRVLLVALLLVAAPLSSDGLAAETFDHAHSAWNQLVAADVHWNASSTASRVDYAEFQRKRGLLAGYLQQLAVVSLKDFDKFNRDQQLAFLINAYNAFTVELILSRYPDLESIKDLGSLFSSPWKKDFFDLFGEPQNLDGIEHNLIRGSGRYDEPLIHFVVNCASIGCPALLNEAYVAEELDRQLLDSTHRFLGDRTRNRFDAETGTLEISRIFDWYAEDFERGWRGYESLHDFFRIHADWITDDEETAERLRSGPLKIKFLEYDWRLNDYR